MKTWQSKMAARSDAAATLGPNDGAFTSFNVVCSSPNSVNLQLIHKEITPKYIYDRQSLLDIGNAYKHQLLPVATEKLRGLCLLLKRPRLLTLPAQGSVASGVREDGSAVSAEVYELG